MIRDLVRDEAVLSTPSVKATADDAELANDLVETLESLEEVACLAANQIGETKQIVAFYDDADEVHVVYNPKLLRALYPVKVEEECMTVDGVFKVTRYGRITISYEEMVDGKLVARKREFLGNSAQAIQHAMDHFKGKLI